MTYALIFILLLAGCGSSKDLGPAELIPAKFQVRQPAGQILTTFSSSSVEIQLLVDIFNESSEPITLRRLQLQSVIGGFRFPPTARIFHKTIAPHGVETFDLLVRIQAESPGTDIRAPVMVRGTAIFDSPVGGFRRVFTSEIIEHGTPRERR